MEKGKGKSKRKDLRKEELPQQFKEYLEKAGERATWQLPYHWALKQLQAASAFPLSPAKYKELYDKLGMRDLVQKHHGAGLLCPVCNGLVIADNGKINKSKKYCSEKCKVTAKSKRWRDKYPEKKLESNRKYLNFQKESGDL